MKKQCNQCMLYLAKKPFLQRRQHKMAGVDLFAARQSCSLWFQHAKFLWTLLTKVRFSRAHLSFNLQRLTLKSLVSYAINLHTASISVVVHLFIHWIGLLLENVIHSLFVLSCQLWVIMYENFITKKFHGPKLSRRFWDISGPKKPIYHSGNPAYSQNWNRVKCVTVRRWKVMAKLFWKHCKVNLIFHYTFRVPFRLWKASFQFFKLMSPKRTSQSTARREIRKS